MYRPRLGRRGGARSRTTWICRQPVLGQLSWLCPLPICSNCTSGLWGSCWGGSWAGTGCQIFLHCPAVPFVRMLKAFQLKEKAVRQDKDVIYCKGETLPSHRKPMASHALAETSGWPNLIKYSCCGFPNSDCESRWHRSPKAFDRDNCPCWALLLFQHPPWRHFSHLHRCAHLLPLFGSRSCRSSVFSPEACAGTCWFGHRAHPHGARVQHPLAILIWHALTCHGIFWTAASVALFKS